MPSVVANRYARALADVVAAEGDFRKVLTELQDFNEAYRESLELREVCDNPAIPIARKFGVLLTLGGKMGLSHLTVNFLKVLISHYRMPLLGECVEAFRNLAYARLGIVRVNITSAEPLSDEQRQTVQKRFSQLTHSQSELEFHLDEALIGGLVAQIGSTVYDGSIRGRLDRLKEKLLER